MLLLELPVELRHKIYNLLIDRRLLGMDAYLKRLSACSKDLRKDIAPLLWARMNVGWKPKGEAVLRNFVYAKVIVFEFNGSHIEDEDTLCRTFKTHINHCGASLRKIIISQYNLDGMGKSLGEAKKLPNLREMLFTKITQRGKRHSMTAENMQAISQFPSLERLEMYHEKLEPSAFKALCSESFVTLKSLILHESRLTDPGLTMLKNLKSLVSLTLRGASITHVGLKRINGLLRLKELDLYDCKRIKSVPILKELPSLIKLSLMATPITNESIINLKALPSLRRLNISFCKNVMAVGLDSLIALPSLEVLRCEGALSTQEMDVVKRKLKCVVQDDYMRKAYDQKTDPWYKEVEDSRCCS